VSNEGPSDVELWQLIEQGLNEFKILDTEYDRNSASSKNFNKDLSKSVGAKSHKQFWENSQSMVVTVKDDSYFLETINRAVNYKGYQGYFLPPEQFDKNSTLSIANRILKIVKLMNE